MSLEKLSPDCLTLMFQYIDIITIQELAITSKVLRSVCLAAQYDEPVFMPKSKVKLPEILLEITTVIRVDETIERTETDWLSQVLRHFNRVKVIDVAVKNLSRTVIRDILNICKASKAARIVIVSNVEVMKWASIKKK